MGNFSRNTYAPQKNYFGVRLQQGVPLVDADWNELNDVLLQETYRAAAEGIGTGVRPSNNALPPLNVWTSPGAGMTNDLWALAGSGVVAGQAIQIVHTRYTTQPYADAATAAAAGVPVVPPLTTPGAARTDVVYLDVWTREVGATEDSNLVNPVIGVETAVRLKRDYALRVAEGSELVPNPAAGHVHLGLAYLNRTASAQILTEMIVDMKPTLLGASGPRRQSVLPSFQNTPLSTGAGWQTGFPLVPKFYATKASVDNAMGILPIQLPEGSRISSIRYRGRMNGQLTFQLVRIATRPTTALFGSVDNVVTPEDYLNISSTTISPPTVGTTSPFDQFVNVAPVHDGRHITRQAEHFHVLIANAGSGVIAYITGITVLYEV